MTEPKIESEVKYDDRKKEMTHVTKETREAKIGETIIGEVSVESKGIYNETGIKKILKDLKNRRTQLEQAVSAQKKEVENIPEMTKDLTELKEKLTNLQKIDQAEKQKVQLETNNKDLVQVKKDIRDIEGTVGSRLKL